MGTLDVGKSLKEPLNKSEAIDVYLFKNGQRDAPPRKYHFTQNDLCSWNDTLKHLADIQNETDHSLDLYKLNGEKVADPLELQHGASYVVVHSNESFRDSGYESYIVEASRSMEKRLKQTNTNAANSVPTLNKIAGKKVKKLKAHTNAPQTDTAKEKETKSKPSNITQINNLSHKPTWPGKRKEDTNVPKVTRSPSPIRRRPSPVKKTKSLRQESPITKASNTKSAREISAFNKQTLEGVPNYETNIGHLIFQDMNIKKHLEKDNSRLLIMLEKKSLSKVDVGTQALVVNIDGSNDAPLDLVPNENKAVQNPSNTSVSRNYSKENYIALMQPDGSIQLTIKLLSSGGGVTTDITNKNNVEIIKFDDNDHFSSFLVDTSQPNKVIKIAIRCLSDTSNHSELVEYEDMEIKQIPFPVQHQEIREQEIVTKINSKGALTDKIIYSTNSNAVEKHGLCQYSQYNMTDLLDKHRNEIIVLTEHATKKLENSPKSPITVSEETDKRISFNEDEPIMLLQPGIKPMDFNLNKIFVTSQNVSDQNSDGTSLPQRQIKCCYVMDPSASKLLPIEVNQNVLRVCKETNTPNRLQTKDSNLNMNQSQTIHNSRFENTDLHPGVEHTCDYCCYKLPPCPPQCTPVANVSTTASESESRVCHVPMDKFCQYIQTDSCEVLLMVRRHLEDCQFSFHFPTIKDLKDYKLI